MFSMSCLTTLKLTSASNSAMRISRRALSMFSAESLPSPRRFLNTRCSLSDRLSNMRIDQTRKGIRARDLVESSYYSCYSAAAGAAGGGMRRLLAAIFPVRSMPCLLYTSDAADEEDSVDLGG